MSELPGLSPNNDPAHGLPASLIGIPERHAIAVRRGFTQLQAGLSVRYFLASSRDVVVHVVFSLQPLPAACMPRGIA